LRSQTKKDDGPAQRVQPGVGASTNACQRWEGDQPRPGEMLSSLAHRPGGQGGGQSSVQRLCQHSGHHKAGEWGKVPHSEEEILPRVLRGHLLPGQCDTQWVCRPWIPGLAKSSRAAWRGQHLWRGQNHQKATLKLLSRTSLTKQGFPVPVG
jgi:hypothetical protein